MSSECRHSWVESNLGETSRIQGNNYDIVTLAVALDCRCGLFKTTQRFVREYKEGFIDVDIQSAKRTRLLP